MTLLISSLIIFVFGFALGTHKLVNREPENTATKRFRYAVIILSLSLIFGFSYGVDLIIHRTLHDRCAFALINCLLTLLFYGTAAHYFFYLICKRTHDLLFRKLYSLWGKFKFIHYPFIAVLLIVPYHLIYVKSDKGAIYLAEGAIFERPHLAVLLAYAAGILTGFLVRMISTGKPFEKTARLASSCLVFVTILICLILQLDSFVKVSLFNSDVLVRFIAGLTVTVIFFHMLYLNVLSDESAT